MGKALNLGLQEARGLNRRERKREEARMAILAAASQVFRKRGFASAGMREIGEAADLSSANLYHYFRSKDEILYFCQDRTLDRVLDTLERLRKTRGPSVAERMLTLGMTHVLCLIEGIEGTAAHFEVDPVTPGLREAITAKREKYKLGVSALIALGIRRGEFRRCNTTFAMRGFLGALNWTPHWYQPEGPYSPQEVARQMAEYAVAGLLRCTNKHGD